MKVYLARFGAATCTTNQPRWHIKSTTLMRARSLCHATTARTGKRHSRIRRRCLEQARQHIIATLFGGQVMVCRSWRVLRAWSMKVFMTSDHSCTPTAADTETRKTARQRIMGLRPRINLALLPTMLRCCDGPRIARLVQLSDFTKAIIGAY